MSTLIELFITLFAHWLHNGPDKGWQGKLRRYLVVTIALSASLTVLWLYFSHLNDMGTAVSIAAGVGILIAGVIAWSFYLAFGDIRRLAEEDETD